MKVLYVASNPAQEKTLLLEDEINVLQSFAAGASTTGVRFTFLPRLPIEELPSAIGNAKADIVHISAHGTKSGVSLATSWGLGATLTATALKTWLNVEPRPPQLVVLNACDSAAIAQEIAGNPVPMAIGTSAEVSNGAGREAIRLLYERLVEGYSVQAAVDACDQMARTIDNQTVSIKLYHADHIKPDRQFFFASPKIVAKLRKEVPNKKTGEYSLDIGIIGCHEETHQVVFFTDDETYITDDDELENDLCEVVRTNPAGGCIWTNTAWTAYGQIRIFACGVTAGGERFGASSPLTEALLRFHRIVSPKSNAPVPEALARAVDNLIRLDGSKLNEVLAENEARRQKEQTKRKKKKRRKAN